MDYTIHLNKIKMKSQTNITTQEKTDIIEYAYNETISYLKQRNLKYEESSEKKNIFKINRTNK